MRHVPVLARRSTRSLIFSIFLAVSVPDIRVVLLPIAPKSLLSLSPFPSPLSQPFSPEGSEAAAARIVTQGTRRDITLKIRLKIKSRLKSILTYHIAVPVFNRFSTPSEVRVELSLPIWAV